MSEKLDEVLIRPERLDELIEFKTPLEILLEAEEEYLIHHGWKLSVFYSTFDLEGKRYSDLKWIDPQSDLREKFSQEDAIKKQRSIDTIRTEK